MVKALEKETTDSKVTKDTKDKGETKDSPQESSKASWNHLYSTLNYASKQGDEDSLGTYKLCSNNQQQTRAFFDEYLADKETFLVQEGAAAPRVHQAS
jgi:hypothetical protein